MINKGETKTLLEYIRSGSEEKRNKAINSIARDRKLYNTIAAFVRSNNGDNTDARTVFDDTIVLFVRKIFENPTLEINTNINAYMIGVAKNVWFNELRKRKNNKTASLENVPDSVDSHDTSATILMKGERREILHQILSLMKTKCKEVLMHWSAGYSMVEIAEKVGYKSEGVARKKKSECMKQLLNYLSEQPKLKDKLRI